MTIPLIFDADGMARWARAAGDQLDHEQTCDMLGRVGRNTAPRLLAQLDTDGLLTPDAYRAVPEVDHAHVNLPRPAH